MNPINYFATTPFVDKEVSKKRKREGEGFSQPNSDRPIENRIADIKRRFFFSIQEEFLAQNKLKKRADAYSQLIKMLSDAKIFNDQNFDLVLHHSSPEELYSALTCLDLKHLSQENFTMIGMYKSPFFCVIFINDIISRGLINSNFIKERNKIDGFSDLFELSSELFLSGLYEEYRDRVLQHPDRSFLLTGWQNLKSYDIDCNYFQLFFFDDELEYIDQLLREIPSSILNQYKDQILSYPKPVEILKTIFKAEDAFQLGFENWIVEEILKIEKDPMMVFSFRQLDENMLPKHQYKELLLQCEDPITLASIIIHLNNLNILNANSISIVADPDYILVDTNRILELFVEIQREQEIDLSDFMHRNLDLIVYCSEILLEHFNRLPIREITQEVVEESIRRCSLEEVETELLIYVEELLHQNRMDGGGLNDAQSTHFASVHQAVSESAIRLKNEYHAEMTRKGCDLIIEEMKGFDFSSLTGEPLVQFKVQVVKRCLNRIAFRYFNYKDSHSKITLKSLLAYCWLAIHDEKKRECELKDALKAWMNGLYDIQRGYNFNANGVDFYLNEVDRPICLAGTFNKLIEILCGIHPLAEIRMITPSSAALKFPIIVKEKLKKYLLSLPDYSDLLDQLNDGILPEIWDQIKPEVSASFLEEFQVLFQDAENAFYKQILSRWDEVEIKDLICQLKEQKSLNLR